MFMIFDWNEEKNNQLKKERSISFETVVLKIEEGCILDVLEHTNKEKYKNQILIIINIDEYAYVVPAVKEKEYWFLKTIFSSRKYTDLYLPKVRRNI